jgi:hypothetical protein
VTTSPSASRYTRGLVLIHHGGADSEQGFAQLAAVRELSTQQRLTMTMLPAIDTYFARRKARDGDLERQLNCPAMSLTVCMQAVECSPGVWQ